MIKDEESLPVYMQEYGPPKPMTSYTYHFDTKSKHIIGHTDGIEAVAQAVYLYLNIERYDWDIFPDDYGVEMRDLFGKEPHYVARVLEQRIKDCLSIDTRIDDLKDFETKIDDTKIYVRFTVVSTEGEFVEELEFEEG